MMAHSWAQAGFTDILFPQPLKTNAGAFPGADGYGVNSDYDLGSINTTRFGGKATRFGDDVKLRRAIAICKANGLNVLLDYVPHQRAGGNPSGVYRYQSSTGSTNGRFPKDPPCFRGSPPRVPEDPVPDAPDDFEFFDELCPVNALPKGYVWDNLIAAADWLRRTTDADGFRLDDMKGMALSFMNALLSSTAMRDVWCFAEYASGDRNDTIWWCNQIHRPVSAADFDTHYNAIMPMCNEAGSGKFSMAWLAGKGMAAVDPMRAVPFVESMDSDTNGFATVVDNKELGYALLLTGEGLPMVYIRDYLQEPDCYGLEAPINNLVWINRMLANGPTVHRFGDQHAFVFERTGAPGLLVALSNDVWNPMWRTINVQTSFGPNVQLHDYTGHDNDDVWTDQNGRVTISIPPAANGKGYSCWSRAGNYNPVPLKERTTTQTFFGAPDLIPGGLTNNTDYVGQVWCAAGSEIKTTLLYDAPPGVGELTTNVHVFGPDGEIVLDGKAAKDGWHILQAGCTYPKLTDPVPFELTVTYKATKHLTRDDIATDPAIPGLQLRQDEIDHIHRQSLALYEHRQHRRIRHVAKSHPDVAERLKASISPQTREFSGLARFDSTAGPEHDHDRVLVGMVYAEEDTKLVASVVADFESMNGRDTLCFAWDCPDGTTTNGNGAVTAYIDTAVFEHRTKTTGPYALYVRPKNPAEQVSVPYRVKVSYTGVSV